MSTHRNIDRICCVVLIFTLLITALFLWSDKLGIQNVSAAEYESALFDTSKVHTIDIEMDDWDGFLENCTDEEYEECAVTVDGEKYAGVGIRAKGNTSLSSVAAYGNDRYSFKIEFDHYDSGISYYGLDKLSLNNIIQDNTYLKDYLVYRMMDEFGVDAPLCSFVYITVNGEEWGLYLAVEAVEESFLERNYGSDYGELYKPDSMNMGGGRGNGREFDEGNVEEFFGADGEDFSGGRGINPPEEGADGEFGSQRIDSPESSAAEPGSEISGNSEAGEKERPAAGQGGAENEPPAAPQDASSAGDSSQREGQGGGPAGFGGGNDDVSLIYSDDEYNSYSNIFDNAKTDISDGDKDRLIQSLKLLNDGEDIEDVVDVEEVIRYFVVHNFVCNFDSYTGSMIHNYYLYEEDGQLSMIPWDYNLAFGGFSAGGFGGGAEMPQDAGEHFGSEEVSGEETGDEETVQSGGQEISVQDTSSQATSLVNYPIDTPVSGGTVESRPMLAWIFESEEYTQLYHEYFSRFISQYFDSGYFEQMFDSVVELISPYVEKDPTAFCTYEEFQTGVSVLKEFCLLRAESVSGQLNATIPSDSEGQQKDSSSLVDASHLTISDMGSMGMGGKEGPGGMSPPDFGDFDGARIRESGGGDGADLSSAESFSEAFSADSGGGISGTEESERGGSFGAEDAGSDDAAQVSLSGG